jgi:hypothetical protein
MLVPTPGCIFSIETQATPTATSQDRPQASSSVPNANSDANFGLEPYYPTVSFDLPSDPFFPAENGTGSMGMTGVNGGDMFDWSTFLTGVNNSQDDQQFMELLRWTIPEFNEPEGNT